MNKFASLFAVALLLANSFSWAEADRSADLRYCLDLPTAQQIAECSGEISPIKKGKPFSKEKVEKILTKEKASAPISANESSASPATSSDKPGKNSLPEKTESNNN